MGPDSPCTKSLDSTLAFANGTTQVRSVKAPANPTYDCFIVYNTNSMDLAGNSDWDVKQDDEVYAVRYQFGQYGEGCRMFAPMYRSMTALGVGGMVPENTVNMSLALSDIYNAWDYYMTALNQGRPFIIVAFSQGAMLTAELLYRRIMNTPCQKQLLISAHLSGAWMPIGGPVEDSNLSPHLNGLNREALLFSTPITETDLCSSAKLTGCIVTFSSYSSTRPPSKWSRIHAGVGDSCNDTISNWDPPMKIPCVNPAELLGETYRAFDL